jgi:hypothetical protein
MRAFTAFLLLSFSFCSYANDREIQRALIQRDQQSAEFAARGVEARRSLETLHSNQLRDAGQPPLPFERQQMAREREMFPPLSEPKAKPGSEPDFGTGIGRKPGSDPGFGLPLPGSGGPPHVVVPISTPSIGG